MILAALGGVLSAVLTACARTARRWWWYVLSAAVTIPLLLIVSSRGSDAAVGVFLALIVAGAWVPETVVARARRRAGRSEPTD
ncbi:MULTISPECIES: hypothetical protein [unclassified Isoptericola]|uniref:hypothetical protein n=1 Tax=Isoptericola sp. NPDC057191 TaxID=3346041 RepID=UPI0036442CEF